MEYTPEETELVAVWRDLLERHARLTGALERRLQEEHGLGVSEYEVLERLAGADKPERRMQDLADAVHLSQSALSRVVARLEADGLVSAWHVRRGPPRHLRLPDRQRARALRGRAADAARRARRAVASGHRRLALTR